MTIERIPLKTVPAEFSTDLEAQVDTIVTSVGIVKVKAILKLFARFLLWLDRRVRALEENR